MLDRENTLGGTFQLKISGLVQGVGFRPFIFKLAGLYRLSGWVENRNDGVFIRFNAGVEEAEEFRKSVLREAPEAADIMEAVLEQVEAESFDDFLIRDSADLSSRITEISPDIAVCRDCLEDMQSQPHRLDYPFINCTRCGPRFTIIRQLPYDRPNTTMEAFPMCPLCRSEYEDVHNRRFHAQPVACKHCGPVYSLKTRDSRFSGLREILQRVASGVDKGQVFALKGMGGFHLLCDAGNAGAVERLRSIKERDGKPFALMCASLQAAREYVEISDREKDLLLSWRRPIVLLKSNGRVAPGIADGLSHLGVMLPYMPFHHLLFREMETDCMVLTSGNLSDEPILIEDEKAEGQFGRSVEGIIHYNREIHNRCDDSVAMVAGGTVRILRRSRGYAPAPIRTGMRTEGIFAAGAELVSSFALGKDQNVFMSQYVGDLKNWETFNFYREIYERFSAMFRFSPEVVAHDLHPDYLSTRFARELLEMHPGADSIAVQHHHAHIASQMLENRLEGEVLGFSFDGLGLGEDGHMWGGEAMIAGYGTYQRSFHFEYMPMPGGDKASKEPWRMAVAYLYACLGAGFQDWPLPIFDEIGVKEVETIRHMIDRKLNAPLASSAGRLFDAVAAILGLNYRSTYQAEAPMLLEALADPAEEGVYPYELEDGVLGFKPMIIQIVEESLEGCPSSLISARFHNTLVRAILDMALEMRRESSIRRVILSGGSFQNRILIEKTEKGLAGEGFELIRPGRIPVNDQGIAAGQLAVAAARL